MVQSKYVRLGDVGGSGYVFIFVVDCSIFFVFFSLCV